MKESNLSSLQRAKTASRALKTSVATLAFYAVGTHTVYAQDAITAAADTFKTGLTLTVNVLAALVVVASIVVIVMKLFAVAKDRATWAEVAWSVIGAAVIAVVIGGLAAAAAPLIAAI